MNPKINLRENVIFIKPRNLDTAKYSRTSVARTLMARLPRLFRTRS